MKFFSRDLKLSQTVQVHERYSKHNRKSVGKKKHESYAEFELDEAVISRIRFFIIKKHWKLIEFEHIGVNSHNENTKINSKRK